MVAGAVNWVGVGHVNLVQYSGKVHPDAAIKGNPAAVLGGAVRRVALVHRQRLS